MFENILTSISDFSPITVYLVLLFLPFIENIFPPSPSDVVIVVCGSIVASGGLNFIFALMLTILGSEAGFLFLFYLGIQTDKRIVQAGKLKFISKEALDTAENWFRKYGFGLIIFNRFLPGIRSVIAYFAGVSELPVKKTVIYSSISALMWNFLLLTLGFFIGDNIKQVDEVLSTYTNAFIMLLTAVSLFFIYRFIRKKYRPA